MDRAGMEDLLTRAPVGFLGLCDRDAPYVVPLNFVWLDGRICFHCASEGRKVDLLRDHPRVSFTVAENLGVIPSRSPCIIGTAYRSVMVTGRARFLADPAEKRRALQALLDKYVPEGGYAPLTDQAVREFRSRRGGHTEVVEILVETLTRKANLALGNSGS